MIKYLGSKRVIVPRLVELFGQLDGVERVADLFSGTSRVGHALKRAGFAVTANDHNRYAATLARCYVQADHEKHAEAATVRLAELATLPPEPGYFSRTFCKESRFFQPHNGARIDAIRTRIDEWAAAGELTDELEAILLVSLMEAADRVDSTTGVQMAYLKSWAARSHNELELRLPELLPRALAGPGRALCLDATEAAALVADKVDAVYLDPPYNQHKYLGNYHIWETLVCNDTPESYGIAKKRVDCRDRSSDFNSKPRAPEALRAVIEATLAGDRVRHLVLSFSNEGYHSRPDLESMLAPHGKLEVLELDHKRYVGAQIGIHNPAGQKVGTVSHLRNTELVFHLAR
jgi:adenine-specific DNA-methyltransferase